MPLRHDFQPLRHEGAVEAAQLRHVRYRAQGDDVQQVQYVGLGPAGEPAARVERFQKPRAQQEGDTDRRQMAVDGGIGMLVQTIGVHQRKGFGKLRRAFMMIDHDDVHAGRLGHRQRLERLCAAIDGDDQARALARQPHQRLARGAIALHQPVGDIGFGMQAKVAQQADEQRRAGRAIDVIIAEDAHILLRLDRVGDPLGRRIHVAKQAGVGHEGANGGVAVRVQRVARTAARQQQLRHQIVGQIGWVARIGIAAPPAPGLTGQGA